MPAPNKHLELNVAAYCGWWGQARPWLDDLAVAIDVGADLDVPVRLERAAHQVFGMPPSEIRREVFILAGHLHMHAARAAEVLAAEKGYAEDEADATWIAEALTSLASLGVGA